MRRTLGPDNEPKILEIAEAAKQSFRRVFQWTSSASRRVPLNCSDNRDVEMVQARPGPRLSDLGHCPSVRQSAYLKWDCRYSGRGMHLPQMINCRRNTTYPPAQDTL